jgi:hypothetical protein
MRAIAPDGALRRQRSRLAAYTTPQGASREIITQPAWDGGTLVIDRVVGTRADERLVGHLAADESPQNAGILCRLYMKSRHRGRCRRLLARDLQGIPSRLSAGHTEASCEEDELLTDAHGFAYQLAAAGEEHPCPELRWRASSPRSRTPVSLRVVVGALESYEPARAITTRALQRHAQDTSLSVVRLRLELERLDASPIVLSRGLREAVQRAVREGGLSMSEIARRCGRIKRDARGNESGETSWLGRRIGLLPEGGAEAPTPWVHSDVLALIAREGLGIAPREVEVG